MIRVKKSILLGLLSMIFVLPGCREEQKIEAVKPVKKDVAKKEDVQPMPKPEPKKPLKNKGAVEIETVEEFKMTLKNGNPTYAFFHSHTCPPCQRTEPTVNKLAKKYAAKMNTASVLASNSKLDKLFDENNVEGYPTHVFFDKNGKVVKKHVGAVSESELESLIKESFGATVKP